MVKGSFYKKWINEEFPKIRKEFTPIVPMNNKNPPTVTTNHVMPPLLNDEMPCVSKGNYSSIRTPAEEVRPEYFARTKPEDNDTTGTNEPTAFTPTSVTDTIPKDNLHVSGRGEGGWWGSFENLEPITPEVSRGISTMVSPNQSE